MANRKFEKLPFSRMRSEGFPLIVWGGWTLVRLQLLVGSPLRRRRVVVASLIPSYGGSCKSPFRTFPRSLSCRFANVSKVSKLKDVSHETRFGAPACLVSSLWFSSGVPVSMGEAAKPCLVSSLCFSSGVAVSMGEAAKTRLFCCAHVAVSMGEAAKPRSFCCAHVAVSMGEAAKPQSLLFLWRRRVYRGSCKTSLVLLRRVSAIFVDFVQALYYKVVLGSSFVQTL